MPPDSDNGRLKTAETIGRMSATLDIVADTVKSIDIKVDTLSEESVRQGVCLQEHDTRITRLEAKPFSISKTIFRWAAIIGGGLTGAGILLWKHLL